MAVDQIFISLRFSEAMPEAIALKEELERSGVSAFLCAVPEGDDIASAIINAIDQCRLVVVMGTLTCVAPTGFAACITKLPFHSELYLGILVYSCSCPHSLS